MSLEGFLLVWFDELEDDADLRRERNSEPLIAKEGNSIPEHRLKMNPEITVVSIVDLALDLSGMRWLLCL